MSTKNVVFNNPKEFLSVLNKTYPFAKKWIKPQIFESEIPWPQEYFQTNGIGGANITGHFIKNNLKTPTTVIEGRCTKDKLLYELKKEKYSHVGFSVITNDFTNFIECTKLVRTHYPEITIIAGGYGSVYPIIENYVDYVCKGRGVPFLREILNEDINEQYNIGSIPYQIVAKVGNNKVIRDVLIITNKIGCPNDCNFCQTNKLFHNEFSKNIITPQEMFDFIIDYKKKNGNKTFTIQFAEPTAIIYKKWWYELFELFENIKGDFPLYLPTTSSSLKNLDFERITNSSLRFDTILIGIESFTKKYKKNTNVDLPKLIDKLNFYGIATLGTFVIGVPNQTKEDIRLEVSKFARLNLSWYELHNLKLSPLTSDIFIDKDDQVDKIPIDFHHLHGFQAFKHDYLKTGFEDLWPLTYELNKFCEKEFLPYTVNLYQVTKNLLKIKNSKLVKRNMKIYQIVSKKIFPIWKNYFNPSKNQIAKYIEKIDF